LEFKDGVGNQFPKATPINPGEEDADTGRISMLSPLGAALIGVAGQTVRCRAPSGELRMLRLLKMLPPSAGGGGQ
jgi:regulator of nucleoside diphosphate kinase